MRNKLQPRCAVTYDVTEIDDTEIDLIWEEPVHQPNNSKGTFSSDDEYELHYGKEWAGIEFIHNEIDYAVKEINKALDNVSAYIWLDYQDNLMCGRRFDTLYQLIYLKISENYIEQNNIVGFLPIECGHCGVEFLPKSKKEIYCSTKCKHAKKIERTLDKRRTKTLELSTEMRVLKSLSDHITNRNYNRYIDDTISKEIKNTVKDYEEKLLNCNADFNKIILELDVYFREKCNCKTRCAKSIASYYNGLWQRKRKCAGLDLLTNPLKK